MINPAGRRGLRSGLSRAHISALESRMQTQSGELSLPARSDYDRRKRWLDSFARLVSKPFPGLVPVLCRWYAAFRSFRGHIRIQSATVGGRVDLGCAVQLEDGCYQANTRTLARAAGIEKLQAIHRWVDIVDLRIFLMGFEAGEEYSNTHCPRKDSSTSCSTHV